MAVQHEGDAAGVERGIGEVAPPRASNSHVDVGPRAGGEARQVPAGFQRQAARSDRDRRTGIEHRRCRLRQPEQPQRLELDLPVEAHAAEVREGHASADPNRLLPVQRRVGHHRAGVQRRDVPHHRTAGATGATSCPFLCMFPPGDAAVAGF